MRGQKIEKVKGRKTSSWRRRRCVQIQKETERERERDIKEKRGRKRMMPAVSSITLP